MKSRVIVFTLLLSMAVGLLAGCTGKNTEGTGPDGQEEQKNAYIPVEVTQVARKTIANTTIVSGKVSPERDVMVLPSFPGIVKSVVVKEGDRVKKGDVLFTMDEGEIQKQVEQAEAAYEMAKASYNISQEQVSVAQESLERTVNLADSTLAKARENLNNMRRLYNAGAISKDQLDQAILAFEQQEAQMEAQISQAELGASDQGLEVARAQLRQAELAYNQAKDALNKATVTAPIDGIVTGIMIQAGGVAVNTQPAMNIIDMDRICISVQVAEGVVNKLAQGQEVSVSIPAASSEPFKAVIDAISPAVNAITQLYPIKIYLENPDGKIKPGMFANVEIATDVREEVIAIPSEAVVIKDEKNVVFVVENGRAVMKEVKVGLDTGSEIEILEGLKEGDIIVINGQHYLADGGAVKVVGGIEE